MNEYSDNIKTTLDQYRQAYYLYERLVEEVIFTLREKINESSIKIANILGRTKEVDSLKNKLERKEYPEGFQQIPDLAGARVVCLYESDIDKVTEIIKKEFDIIEQENKADDLGTDRMGYQGFHFVVRLGAAFKGPRYNKVRGLNCEIQVRTVLQDAWSTISHHLAYKHESSIPGKLKRDLNNVMSLIEIAQGIFDVVKEKRAIYLNEILRTKATDFLSQPIDRDTLWAYTDWKFPGLPTDDYWASRLLQDLDRDQFITLKDIDQAVEKAKPAVEAYRNENPNTFTYGTDFLTKTLGFIDIGFRKRHPFGQKTKIAFDKYSHLIKQEGKT